MKPFYLILFVSAFLSQKTLAQVGIGNTSPNASLDISATNASAPNNNEGLLIPRIDEFPAINPTALQDGMLVFVSGSGTPSEGFYYWDQGTTTWVVINGAKNTLDEAYDEGGAGVGKNITADNGSLRIDGTDGLLITGTFASGATISSEVTGAGTRMFFNPRTGGFRAGTVDGNQWDGSSIGNYSVAMGNSTTASGVASVAFGDDAVASNFATVAMGTNSVASGNSAISIGSFNSASATASVAIGANNNASGNTSLALGNGTVASGYRATAMGGNSTATGDFSTSIGFNSTAQAYASFVMGRYNNLAGTTNSWNNGEPIFVIGNGTDTSNRSNAFTVLKNGKTGIGQNYPQSPLHVGIETTFDLSYDNTGQDGLFLKGREDFTGINTIGSSIGFGAPRRNTFRRAAIASVQTSGDPDHVGLAFFIHSNPANLTDMVEAMRITHAGIGINNTSPDANLDVVGTFQYVDGNETAGYVLASDASGNASWTVPSTLITGSDDQNIENLSFNSSTNVLTVGIENGASQTVDLSALTPVSKSVVKADLSANQSIAASTYTKIIFDQTITDRNLEFDTVNNRFVATNNGFYNITANVFINGSGSFTIAICKNGAPLTNTIAIKNSTVSTFGAISISTVEELAATDYLEVYTWGGNSFLVNQSSDLTQFNIFQID
ncbi:MAG: hypothetical protein R2793_05090 [Flavobacteriaceae bacterium]